MGKSAPNKAKSSLSSSGSVAACGSFVSVATTGGVFEAVPALVPVPATSSTSSAKKEIFGR